MQRHPSSLLLLFPPNPLFLLLLYTKLPERGEREKRSRTGQGQSRAEHAFVRPFERAPSLPPSLTTRLAPPLSPLSLSFSQILLLLLLLLLLLPPVGACVRVQCATIVEKEGKKRGIFPRQVSRSLSSLQSVRKVSGSVLHQEGGGNFCFSLFFGTYLTHTDTQVKKNSFVSQRRKKTAPLTSFEKQFRQL